MVTVFAWVTLCLACQPVTAYFLTNYTCVVEAVTFPVVTDGCYSRNISFERRVCTALDGHQSEQRKTYINGRQPAHKNASSSCAYFNVTTFTEVMSCFHGYHDISMTLPSTIVRIDNSTLCPVEEVVAITSITEPWKLVLYKYLQPAIILMGLIGNVLSYLVMSTKYMRQFSFSVYLRTLAVLDSVVLLHYGMTYIDTVNYTTAIFAFRMKSYTACLVYPYIVGVAKLSSAWCVVAFTVDRAVAICLPFFARKHMTNFRSRMAIWAVIGLMMLSQVYHVILLEQDIRSCPEPFSFPLADVRFKTIDVFVFISRIILLMFLPFVVVLVCNVNVIVAVRKSRTFAEIKVRRPSDSGNGNQTIRIQERERRMSIKLFSVSITFLMLSLPDAIMMSMDFRNILLDVHKWYLQYNSFRHIARLTFSLNFAVNYLLYGIAFRKQVILFRACRKESTDDTMC